MCKIYLKFSLHRHFKETVINLLPKGGGVAKKKYKNLNRIFLKQKYFQPNHWKTIMKKLPNPLTYYMT